LKKGKQLASAYTEGWEEERAQVKHWLWVLHRNGKDDNVLEIKESTFLRGNRTYRILNAHECWVMATFKTRKEDGPPIDYRVRDPSAITLMEEPGGILTAQVDGEVIPKGRVAAA